MIIIHNPMIINNLYSIHHNLSLFFNKYSKKTLHIFFVVYGIFCLLSCRPVKELDKSETSIKASKMQYDSIVTRDTLVGIPRDTARLIVSVLAPKEDSSLSVTFPPPSIIKDVPETTQTAGRATVKLRIQNDTIFVQANCDSAIVPIKKYYEAHYKAVVDSIIIAKENIAKTETIVYRTRKSIQILAGIGALALVIIGYKVFRKLRPII